MRLKIASVGEPILRTTSRVVTRDELPSVGFQNLIEYMRETVRDAPGVGLAAPQVGESLQIAVIEDKLEYHKGLTESELKERGRVTIPFHVLVNPVIELLTQPEVVFFEGCLSLPGFTALVPRSTHVRLTCLDHRGEHKVIDAQGWYARILQHEIDHLHGKLYLDRMDVRSFSTLENYTRHWKDRKA